jgi:ribosomal protein S18 acetylase RimI-like enzyme
MAQLDRKFNTSIRPATAADLDSIAAIHRESFVRQSRSLEWVTATANSYPRTRYFVAEYGADIVGYVVWTEKSGFRTEAVVELEQIAVLSLFRDRGIGRALVRSLIDVDGALRARYARVKAVSLTTRSDNRARHLYQSSLGAKVQATITDLYSGDEVVMVATEPIAHLTKSSIIGGKP